jgi:uncharacterized protein (DUF4415 family)
MDNGWSHWAGFDPTGRPYVLRSKRKKSSVSFRLARLSHTKGKLMRKLTREQKRDIRAIAAKRDKDIDFSDASAVLDWSGAEVGKFYRPAKKPVTMRLDSDVIAWLKADGRGYQTKANWLLRSAMLHSTTEAGIGRRKVAPQRAKRGGGKAPESSGITRKGGESHET